MYLFDAQKLACMISSGHNNKTVIITYGLLYDHALIIDITGDCEAHLLSKEEGSEDFVMERLTTSHNAADKSEGKNQMNSNSIT